METQMKTQMKDMFGVDLAIGDRVIVITSRYAHSIKVRKGTLLLLNDKGNFKVACDETVGRWYTEDTDELIIPDWRSNRYPRYDYKRGVYVLGQDSSRTLVVKQEPIVVTTTLQLNRIIKDFQHV